MIKQAKYSEMNNQGNGERASLIVYITIGYDAEHQIHASATIQEINAESPVQLS